MLLDLSNGVGLLGRGHEILFENCLFYSNTALSSNEGGGLFLEFDNIVSFNNAVLSTNLAGTNGESHSIEVA